jgi:hypothetical protein
MYAIIDLLPAGSGGGRRMTLSIVTAGGGRSTQRQLPMGAVIDMGHQEDVPR